MNRRKLPADRLLKLEAIMLNALERDCADGILDRMQVQNLLLKYHEVFRSALNSKSVALGTLYEPSMLDGVGTNVEKNFNRLMVFVMPAVWLTFLLAALVTRNWWLLVGIPATWLGMPLRILFFRGESAIFGFKVASLMLAVILLQKGHVMGWPIIGMLVGYLAEDLARRSFRRVMEDRAYESAPCFVYLQLKGPIHFKDLRNDRILPRFDLWQGS